MKIANILSASALCGKRKDFMEINKYSLYTEKQGINLRVACVADLHSRPFSKVISALEKTDPDVILLAGDILEIAAPYMESRNKNGFEFLRHASKIAPVYYTYGNHEIYNSHAKHGNPKKPDEKTSEEYKNIIREFGVHLINDCFEEYKNEKVQNNFYVGGVVCGKDKNPDVDIDMPNLQFVNEFETLNGYKLLLCHYPHYYEKYLRSSDVDLILSGHAHGGQWRVFGRGIYAPHQKFFPKYTSGLHDNKMLISRGVVNNSFIPRIFNPCEVLDINISSK